VDKGRSREQGGTGLGLAIVKHIAQLHGGTVTVTSEPGKGTVFTLRLPV
jgi:two-component system phosphate regulon sensor histidine kinase PhoR